MCSGYPELHVMASCLSRHRAFRTHPFLFSATGDVGVDVADLSQEPGRRKRVVWSNSAKFMAIIRQTGILMRVDEYRTDPATARFVCSSDMLCMSGFPILVDHAAAAKAPCLFTHGQPASSRRTGATMKRQCGNAMCVSHVGAVMIVAFARFPTLGTRCVTGSVTSISPVISSTQHIIEDIEDHENHAAGAAHGGGHAAGVLVGSKRRLGRTGRTAAGAINDEDAWTYDRAVRARRARGLL